MIHFFQVCFCRMHVLNVFHLDRSHSIKHMGMPECLPCIRFSYRRAVSILPFCLNDNRSHLCIRSQKRRKRFFVFFLEHEHVLVCIALAQNILTFSGPGKFQYISSSYTHNVIRCMCLFYDLNLLQLRIQF